MTFKLVRTGKVKQAISSNDRLHIHQKAKITKQLRQLAMYEAVSHHTARNTYRPFNEGRPARVIITVYAPTKRRYDAPNYWPTVKALEDGMTDAGIWSDDNGDVIKETVFKHGGLSGIKDSYKFTIRVEDYVDHELVRDVYEQLTIKHRAVKEALGLEYETGLADTLAYIKELKQKEAEVGK
jgi:crossover junction endodeoxyribonuclease RusA